MDDDRSVSDSVRSHRHRLLDRALEQQPEGPVRVLSAVLYAALALGTFLTAHLVTIQVLQALLG